METQQGYRKDIAEICSRLGFEVLDPWLREKVIYNRDEPRWWEKVPAEGFIQRDLDDTERCDVMVVYLPRLSAGACMELFYAKRKGKKVIVISEIPCVSPWVVLHSDIVLNSLDELEEALKNIF